MRVVFRNGFLLLPILIQLSGCGFDLRLAPTTIEMSRVSSEEFRTRLPELEEDSVARLAARKIYRVDFTTDASIWEKALKRRMAVGVYAWPCGSPDTRVSYPLLFSGPYRMEGALSGETSHKNTTGEYSFFVFAKGDVLPNARLTDRRAYNFIGEERELCFQVQGGNMLRHFVTEEVNFLADFN